MRSVEDRGQRTDEGCVGGRSDHGGEEGLDTTKSKADACDTIIIYTWYLVYDVHVHTYAAERKKEQDWQMVVVVQRRYTHDSIMCGRWNDT